MPHLGKAVSGKVQDGFTSVLEREILCFGP